MVFSSITFLVVFLPVFLLVYAVTPRAYRSVPVLAGSALFYSWGAPQFIFVLFLTTLLDFYAASWIARSQTSWKRKAYLTGSLAINIGLLVYCKYANFFIENVNAALQLAGIERLPFIEVVMPVGISFYTFETITYVVDVYRRVHQPLTRFWDYQRYILLFPKLIAGPIVRYHTIADELNVRKETAADWVHGFSRFCIGLAKKVLLANALGEQADAWLGVPPHQWSTQQAWLGILAYTFQIYFDFSGYSDMAIGLCRMMGFHIPENFNNPYQAQSISDFWRRWHISLGQWMKHYLYIPLGGNRAHTRWRVWFNLWLVFLVSGLWHGASWNFVTWGAYHGTFLVLDRLFLERVLKRAGRIPAVLVTFFIVVIGWVFFRMENLSEAITLLQTLFTVSGSSQDIAVDVKCLLIFLIAAGCAFVSLTGFGRKMQAWIYEGSEKPYWYLSAVLVSLLIYGFCLSELTSGGFNPFIYFRF